MTGIVLIIIIGVIIGALGQISIKTGLQQIGDVKFSNISSVVSFIFEAVKNKFILLGLLLSAISAVLWIITLSKIDLSFGYPLASGLFFIVMIILSSIMLKEKISIMQLIGTAIILFGVVILSKSGI